MANTVIQIKRSSATAAPTAGSLSAAEPAYSYLSDKLFLGSSDGSQVIEIGGRYYINVAIQAYDAANTANDRAVAAFNKANSIISAGGLSSFSNIAVGGTFLVADANADVLTIQSSNGISIVADDVQDSFNIGLSLTGVTATTYGASDTIIPRITVDPYGRITSAANVTIVSASAAAAGANAFAAATIAGANTAVGAGANAFASATIAGANTAIGAGANAFMIAVQNGSNTAIGAGANAFTSATIAGANTAVGAGANNYADATFVKLVAPNQSITGNLAISGSLIVSGNTFKVDANTLVTQDPLIFLAANNDVSDIVDIGFVGQYRNTSSINVYTGLYRDATTKEYHLFDRYSAIPNANDIDPAGNNFSLAVLNAAVRTSNLTLGTTNAIVWITSAFNKANSFDNVYTTIAGSNAFASATIAGANTAVGAGANAFASATIAGANTAVGAGANAFATAAAAGANAYMIAVQNGSNTAIGAGANAYATVVGAAANTNAANASYINTGILAVGFGGTGVNTLSNNGVLFGNTTGAVRLATTSTEGHVLQANQFGTPFFGMLDGGTF